MVEDVVFDWCSEDCPHGRYVAPTEEFTSTQHISEFLGCLVDLGVKLFEDVDQQGLVTYDKDKYWGKDYSWRDFKYVGIGFGNRTWFCQLPLGGVHTVLQGQCLKDFMEDPVRYVYGEEVSEDV